ncbi:MAG: cytochrome c3 family protein [Marinifilaceae bacterium]
MMHIKLPKKIKHILILGFVAGFILALGTTLGSGYMIEATSKDNFCISCHSMKPFRTAWKKSKHGGRNSKGLVAQCTDCHLPHGDLINYVSAKAYTGMHDFVQNLIIDPNEHDWIGKTEARREFTYDNSCLKCHQNLTEGLTISGIMAHREYFLGDLDKRCVDCHKHVGHKDLKTEVKKYFGQ